MLTIVTSHRDQGAASKHGAIGSLAIAVERLLVRLCPNPEADSFRDQAIAILCDSASTADTRDWAERYLCGMTGAGPATYLKRRGHWQS